MMKAPMEVIAWKNAADVGGLELPGELNELYLRVERLEGEQEKVKAEAVENVNAVDALLKGGTLSNAMEAQEISSAIDEKVTESRRVAATAVRIGKEQVSRWIAANRDRLIIEHLRPVVGEVVAEAVKLEPKLKDYAPDYDPAELLTSAPPAVITAWRETRKLNDRFAALLGAWWSSWRAATSNADRGVPGHLRIDEPGGLHVWERPLEVADVEVRDGRDVDLLSIARWAETGGYRLGGGQEILDLTQSVTVEYPWIAGEQRQRQVLLPSTKPDLVQRRGMVGA